MLMYTASDIINRSLEIADLTNTEYFTDNEKLSILNNAYTDVYNKLISGGSTDFIKRIYTSAHKTKLPSDFYRLKHVYYQSGNDLIQIKKRSGSTGFYTFEYDLQGDILTVYGSSTFPIVVEYYPEPVSLTYPKPTLKDYYPTEVSAAYKDYYIAENTLYNINNPDEPIVENLPNDTKLLNEYYMVDNILYDYNGDQFYEFLETEVPVITETRQIYKYVDGAIYNLDGFKIGEIPQHTNTKLILSNDELSDYYVYDTENKMYYNNIELVDIDNFQFKDMSYGDEGIYLLTNTSLYHVQGKQVELIKSGRYSLTDTTDGYGLIKGADRVSSLPDTRLSCTSSIFFSYLSYLVALEFKEKQNAPADNILAALTRYENTLMTSLSSDSAYPTLTNVYGY